MKHSDNVSWILLKSVFRARKQGLYRIVPADKPMRLDCLMDKCAICCEAIGTPVITDDEAKRIGEEKVIKTDDAIFMRSMDCACPFLEKGICSIHKIRPNSCREYPWYNIGGRLYYDKGCPGVKYDRDERPNVQDIEPFERFFPKRKGFVVWLVKKVCVRN